MEETRPPAEKLNANDQTGQVNDQFQDTLDSQDKPRISSFGFLDPPENLDEVGRLGGYRILALLGEGGMGMVFRGEERLTSRHVAIKVMQPQAARHEEARERFLREGRLASSLEHERIVAIYRVDEVKGIPFLVMPLLNGETLEKRLQRQPSFCIEEVVRLGREIAEGLAIAHQAGMIHRDIKPANIWLKSSKFEDASQPHAVLLDFGLARPLKESVILTEGGSVLGTASYMAPEQAAGQQVDPRSDLFSLGCVLYEMTTGRRAFGGPNLMAIMRSLALHTPPSPAQVRSGVPLLLSALIERLMSKDPVGRPTSAIEVIRLLNYVCDGRPLDTPSPAPLISKVSPPFLSPLTERLTGKDQLGQPTFATEAIPRVDSINEVPPPRVASPNYFVSQSRRRWLPVCIAAIGLTVALALSSYFFFAKGGNEASDPAPGGKVDGANKDVSKGGAPPAVAATPSHESPIYGQISSFVGHTGEIRCLAVEPAGRRMLSGSLDHTVKVWDVETAKPLATVKMESPKDAPLAVAFMPDGTNRILVGGSQSVLVYDIDSKRADKMTKLPRDADALAFFPDGKRFCVGNDHSVEIWDLERGELVGRLTENPVAPVTSLFISADSRTIVSGHGGAKAPVFIWDVDRRQLVKTFQVSTESPTPVTAVALDRDGKRLLAANLDGPIRLGDVSRAQFVHTFESNRGVVMQKTMDEGGINPVKLRMGVAFSPDGRRAAIGAPGLVLYQDINELREIFAFKGHKDEIVECVVFSPDGSRLFSAGGDKVVRLWSLPR